MSAPYRPAGGGRLTVSAPLAAVAEPTCLVGWSGCDCYHGGHGCNRPADHRGRHRCDCGATSGRSEP